MKSNLYVAFGGIALIAAMWLQTSCAEAPKSTGVKTESQPMVRTLKLPEIDPVLPAGRGKETVMLQCAVCHTPHYILNQPAFSKEVWTAEITKMQKTFSAPIPDDKIPEILEYLLAVRRPAAQ